MGAGITATYRTPLIFSDWGHRLAEIRKLEEVGL